jgi:hypothetical protein
MLLLPAKVLAILQREDGVDPTGLLDIIVVKM